MDNENLTILVDGKLVGAFQYIDNLEQNSTKTSRKIKRKKDTPKKDDKETHEDN